jgi:hypothetical protein
LDDALRLHSPAASVSPTSTLESIRKRSVSRNMTIGRATLVRRTLT